MKRIGVFSGTFDPFHVAHLESCLVAKASCELTTVAILIERKPKRKRNVTTYKNRLAMTDLAIQSYPSLRLIDTKKDNINTKNITPILKEQFPVSEFWYIFGSDMLDHLPHWDGLDSLINEYKFCVILRRKDDLKYTEQILKDLKKKYNRLTYKILPEVWSDISSSKIRSEISENGYSEFLHRDVIKYIMTNNVY